MDVSDGRVRLLIVDDDPLVRAGLRLLLGGDDLVVVGEAGDGAEAQARVVELRPDVVLMDIRMPGTDGLLATEAIRSLPDPPEIVILTTFDADQHVLRALRAGASGFLLKDTPPPEMMDAIRSVAAGDVRLSPSILRRLITAATADDPRGEEARRRLSLLTDREREIARCIGEGLTNAQIGARLHLSVPTIKAHVSAVLETLGVSNRVQVAILVYEAEGERRSPLAPD